VLSRRADDWIPNAVELKCLRHLDPEENWSGILRQPKPPESQRLGWGPFRLIFVINMIQFTPILAILFVSLELTFGGGVTSLREDALVGSAIVVGLAAIMATYVTYLYRRSWNRRARSLSAES